MTEAGLQQLWFSRLLIWCSWGGGEWRTCSRADLLWTSPQRDDQTKWCHDETDLMGEWERLFRLDQQENALALKDYRTYYLPITFLILPFGWLNSRTINHQLAFISFGNGVVVSKDSLLRNTPSSNASSCSAESISRIQVCWSRDTWKICRSAVQHRDTTTAKCARLHSLWACHIVSVSL